MMKTISRVVTGGQTGVDRAALDAAIEQGLEYGGWCPNGGWAEDKQMSPGLLLTYPGLSETSSSEPEQRTQWNVRDSTATLVLLLDNAMDRSPGTDLTSKIADDLGKPVLITYMDDDHSLATIRTWVMGLGNDIVLNIAGPRESESRGIYTIAKRFISRLLSDMDP